MNHDQPGFPIYPSIFVGWDNTPRRGAQGIIVVNNTPELFGAGLLRLADSVRRSALDEKLIFVNAWNEWAEGNHLEPDRRHGDGLSSPGPSSQGLNPAIGIGLQRQVTIRRRNKVTDITYVRTWQVRSSSMSYHRLALYPSHSHRTNEPRMP